MKNRTAEDWAVSIVAYGLMFIFALATLIPFANILAKTFSEDWAVVSGKVGVIPIGFQTDTILYVLSTKAFWNSFPFPAR